MLRSQLKRSSKTEAFNRLFGNIENNELEIVHFADGELSDGELDDSNELETQQDDFEGDFVVEDVIETGDELDEIIIDGTEEDLDVVSCQYRWRRKKPAEVDHHCEFKLSPPPDHLPTPYEYFRSAFTDELLNYMAIQTNKYSMEKSGRSINVSSAEMEQFIAVLLFSTVMHASDFRMYWQNDLRWPVIADIMSVKRFGTIKQYFHLSDNAALKKKGDENYDPLFKIRHLVNHIRSWCQSIEPTINQSIDEMMVPFKGRLNFKQYMPKKPTKWGIKIFARCSTTGIVHDFIVYTGSDTELRQPLPTLTMTGNIVRSLLLSLPKTDNSKLCFGHQWKKRQSLFLVRP